MLKLLKIARRTMEQVVVIRPSRSVDHCTTSEGEITIACGLHGASTYGRKVVLSGKGSKPVQACETLVCRSLTLVREETPDMGNQ